MILACQNIHDCYWNRQLLPVSNGGVLYLILYIFGGVIAYALIQHELNKLIEQDEA